ncbi:MAG TPA: endonuclease/exonuclease/phosphatase family protein [Verrucomicrobiae bacterium]|nr:endonuclease/exonuclease/phosphatase family protein [Verrucomicrobiae bacterium]
MLKALLIAGSVVVLLGTVLPLFRTDAWWVRVFDFSHLQIAILGLLLAIALVFSRGMFPPTFGWTLLAVAGLCVAANFCWIFPYTRLASKQVLPAKGNQEMVSVLAANVLQGNRNAKTLLDIIRETNPDLILITEADERWTRELQSLTNEYRHTLLHPLENTYGISLYSRLPLVNPEVRFLTDRGVPSIRTGVRCGGQEVLFYGVHPRPPGRPAENDHEPMDSTQRDAELVLVAKEIQKVKGPVIVAGDFNDVAWSHTSRMFRRISRLLDPRVGRGFFNTYHARIPILRFPLDHLFHSDDFTLVKIERLKKIGSDHFPILAVLRLEPGAAAEQEAPPKKPSDEREAVESVQRNREHEAEDGAAVAKH